MADLTQEEKMALWLKEKKEEEERFRQKIRAYMIYKKFDEERKATIAYVEKVHQQDKEAAERAKEELLNAHHEKLSLGLQSIKEQDQNVADFFEEKLEKPEIKENAEKLNIEKEELSHLALASCAQKTSKKERILQVLTGIFSKKEKEDPEVKAMQDDGIAEVNTALAEMVNGKPQRMEKILTNELKEACSQFTLATDSVDAVHWGNHINSLLKVVSTNPMIFQDAKATELLTLAHGAAAMSKIMEDGMDALKSFQEAALSGKQLTDEENLQLTSRIMLMQDTDNKRLNDKDLAKFAKGYHPKKPVNSKYLDSLITQLGESDSFKAFQASKTTDRAIVLSERESSLVLLEKVKKEAKEKEMKKELEKNPKNKEIKEPELKAPVIKN